MSMLNDVTHEMDYICSPNNIFLTLSDETYLSLLALKDIGCREIHQTSIASDNHDLVCTSLSLCKSIVLP